MLKIFVFLIVFTFNKSIEYQYHKNIVKQYFQPRQTWVTSNLGSILFKNQFQITRRSNASFVVLIWKHFDFLKYRHIYRFSEKRLDPLDECSFQNCKFIGRSSKINEVDAVLVYVRQGLLPKKPTRNPKQIWIFMSDESPVNTFFKGVNKQNLQDWSNIFNWSMTYRTDSDIPIPYGRTVALRTPLIRSGLTSDPDTWSDLIANYIPHWNIKSRDVLATLLMSNCGVTERMEYLDDLQKSIKVDVYGKCSKNEEYKYRLSLQNESERKVFFNLIKPACFSCPGHFSSDCKVLNKYLFYLAFENSKCRQYVTEKSFNNAYAKGAIPIILGTPREDCVKLLPPHSFLHVEDFASPKELANKITSIAKSNKSLLAYHWWRNNFEVRNEQGYIGIISTAFCRICEALNINERSTNVYDADSLRLFLDPKLLCN